MKKKFLSSKKQIFGLVFLILLLLFVAFFIYRVVQHLVISAEDGKTQNILAVVAAMPTIGTVRNAPEFTGSLRPWSSFDVAPKVAGRLVELNVTIGDRVLPGAVLARIDDAEYVQEVDAVAADLEVARAQEREAIIQLELKQKEFKRQSELFAKQIISESQFETVQFALQAQEATAAMRRAEVLRKEAALRSAQISLDDTVISGPKTEGTRLYVGSKYVDTGALLSTNQSIFSIVDLARLKAAITVIERDYPLLKLGQKAEITTDAYPGEIFYGTISHISKVLQESARQAEILIEVPNAAMRLRPGMYVKVVIELEKRENAQSVPSEALVQRDGKIGVYCVNPETSRAFFVPTTLGIKHGSLTEVVEPKIEYPVVHVGSRMLVEGTEVILYDENYSRVGEENNGDAI